MRAFTELPDAEGLDPESATRVTTLQRSKVELTELEGKGDEEWYFLKRRYLSLLHERQMPPVTFADLVQ